MSPAPDRIPGFDESLFAEADRFYKTLPNEGTNYDSDYEEPTAWKEHELFKKAMQGMEPSAAWMANAVARRKKEEAQYMAKLKRPKA